MTLDISMIRVKPQDGLHDCGVTVLEYLTGISRNTIAADIGHDGHIEVEGEEQLVGMRTEELISWLHKKGYTIEHISSKACAESEHADKEVPSRIVDNIEEEMAEKVAIIMTRKTSTAPNRIFVCHHVCAWVGNVSIDPVVGVEC